MSGRDNEFVACMAKGALILHLAALRAQRQDTQSGDPVVDAMALKFQELMIAGAIASCRRQGLAEDIILEILGSDMGLAGGGTRMAVDVNEKDRVENLRGQG